VCSSDLYPVIHLYRKNVVAQALSLRRAQATQAFHSRAHRPEDPALARARLHVPPEWVLRKAESLDAQRRRYEGLISARNGLLELAYEDVFPQPRQGEIGAVPETVIAELGAMLGVGDLSPQPNQRKSSPNRTRDMVANFDELEAVLSQSRFAGMLK